MSTIYIDGQAVAVEDLDLDTILAVLPYADGRLVEMTPSGPHLEATLATDLGTIAAAKMAGFEVWDDVLLGTIGAADGPTTITKHYGPGPHPGTGTPQSVHGTGGGGGEDGDIRPGIDDNPTFVRLAKNLHTQAASVEPEITSLFESIADQTGGSLAGLDFRVKSERSIRDKIFRDLRIAQEMGRSTTAEEVALNIRDLNRYALTWPPDEQWVSRHETALQLLKDDGWTIYDDKYKGAWKAGDYYDGSNVHLHKGDTFVELQFHSPQSWDIKEESDIFYNEARVLPVDHPKRDRLLDKIYALWNSDRSHVPPGAEALGSASFMMKGAATQYIFHDPEGVPVCPISVYRSQVHAWVDGAWVLLSITPAEVSESPDYKLAPASIVKHYGPGPHPGTGTDQKVHGSISTTRTRIENTMAGLPEDVQDKIEAKAEEILGSERTIKGRLRKYLNRALKDKNHPGRTWYEDAHEWGEKLPGPPEVALGMTASMSPGMEWTKNKRMVEMLIEHEDTPFSEFQFDTALLNGKLQDYADKYDLKHVDIKPSDSVSSIEDPHLAGVAFYEISAALGDPYPARYGYRPLADAIEILRGATPDEVLPGLKVRSFYNNLLANPDDTDVTIDVQMFGAAAGRNLDDGRPMPDGSTRNSKALMSTLNNSPRVRGEALGVRPLIADYVREIAAEHDLLPRQAQAMIWMEFKAGMGRFGTDR